MYNIICFSTRNTVLILFISLYKLYFHKASSKQNRDMQLTMFKEKNKGKCTPYKFKTEYIHYNPDTAW